MHAGELLAITRSAESITALELRRSNNALLAWRGVVYEFVRENAGGCRRMLARTMAAHMHLTSHNVA